MSTNLLDPVSLGRTGLLVGRLGVGASYGVSQRALEAAFDRGVNYFYWGSRRTQSMGAAIRALVKRGQRHQVVVALQSYDRTGPLLGWSIRRGLKRLGLERADVLILGWHNRCPAQRILDAAVRLREQGLVRFLAVSGHHRPTFRQFIRHGLFDILMVRYSAAHPGAERDVFPHLPEENGPGMTTYTATRWGSLCQPRQTPAGEVTPTAGDCYRFNLSHPAVHLCVTGPGSAEHMEAALTALERGPMDADELAWMRRVGRHVHQRRHFGLRVE